LEFILISPFTDINSPDFSACLLLIQLVWVATDLPQPE